MPDQVQITVRAMGAQVAWIEQVAVEAGTNIVAVAQAVFDAAFESWQAEGDGDGPAEEETA